MPLLPRTLPLLLGTRKPKPGRLQYQASYPPVPFVPPANSYKVNKTRHSSLQGCVPHCVTRHIETRTSFLYSAQTPYVPSYRMPDSGHRIRSAFRPPASAHQGYHKLFKTTLPSSMTCFYTKICLTSWFQWCNNIGQTPISSKVLRVYFFKYIYLYMNISINI